MPSADDCLPGMIPSARQYTAVVDAVRPLARETWAVRIHQPELARQIIPGQFFMVRSAEGSDPLLGRPFALYDTCTDAHGEPVGVEFGFVVVGKLTTLMTHWQPGDAAELWGPLGNGFPVSTARRLICVAGGIGQTPFLAVAQEALGRKTYGNPAGRPMTTRPESITLCYGVRTKALLAGVEDFDLPGLELRLSTDDGSYGHHGFTTDTLRLCLDQGTDSTEVYCCGPEPMMHAVADICQVRKVPCWLSLETPMACGFGACFSCVTRVREDDGTWDYRRTCVEGPVFPSHRLVFD